MYHVLLNKFNETWGAYTPTVISQKTIPFISKVWISLVYLLLDMDVDFFYLPDSLLFIFDKTDTYLD